MGRAPIPTVTEQEAGYTLAVQCRSNDVTKIIKKVKHCGTIIRETDKMACGLDNATTTPAS